MVAHHVWIRQIVLFGYLVDIYIIILHILVPIFIRQSVKESDLFVQGYFNDLWSYSLDENVWTWVSGKNIINDGGVYGLKGQESATAIPGSRYRSVLMMHDQKLWLFGGYNKEGKNFF